MQGKSLTSCGKTKVATALAMRSGLYKGNHLHAVGRQQHQQGGLDLGRRITYRLWKGKGGNNFSKKIYTLQRESLTRYGKTKVATTSARRSGLCKENHLQAVRR